MVPTADDGENMLINYQSILRRMIPVWCASFLFSALRSSPSPSPAPIPPPRRRPLQPIFIIISIHLPSTTHRFRYRGHRHAKDTLLSPVYTQKNNLSLGPNNKNITNRFIY